MSTLKVTNIENPDGGGVSAKIADVNGGQLSNRNLIINGAMQVSQRATSKASITTQAYHTVDRFNLNINALGTWTMSQESSGPDGFAHSLKLLCTTADASPAAADVALIIYRVEGQDLQQLAYGSSAAKQSTLSFYVKSNKTGNATVNLKQPDASNRIYSAQYTISSANTWERKTIVVPADTSGTINDDTGNGLQIEWPLNTGSDYTGGSHGGWKAADNTSRNNSNLGVGGTVNDYYEITGVQLEVGSVATTFEHRSFGDELLSCQRYYQEIVAGRVNLTYFGMSDANGRVVVNLPLARELRTNIAHDTQGTVTRTGVVRVKDGFPSSAANNNDAIDFFISISSSLLLGLSTTASSVNEGSMYLVRMGSVTGETVFTVDNEL